MASAPHVLLIGASGPLAGWIDDDAQVSVDQCANLDEALEALASAHAYDAAIMATWGDAAEERFARLMRAAPGLPVIALVPPGDLAGAEHMATAGVSDVMFAPVSPNLLRLRVTPLVELKERSERLLQHDRDAQTLMGLSHALASALDVREILFTVVRRLAEAVQVERASIVLRKEDASDPSAGVVAVTSDDADLANLRIDLTKYPEIQRVLHTREPLTISDASTHPLLDIVRDQVGALGPCSLTLIPLSFEDEVLGVLFLRSAEGRGALDTRELELCRTVADSAAVALRNANVLAELRAHSEQASHERAKAEAKAKSLKRYAELFDASADGIAVFSADSKLLFANPTAYDMLGYSRDSMTGRKLWDFVHPEDHSRGLRVWSEFTETPRTTRVDMRIIRADRKPIMVSVSASPLPESPGAVLLSFRDVTEERQMAEELRRTKEFLESLVDASADGIIAADLSGDILLFSHGAEELFERSAQDVIGKRNVRELYAEGVAEQVMRTLRSEQYGGPGKLRGMRVDVIGKGGESIPISLSASILYQADKAIATVGIFTDLRSKLQVEERLAAAQHKLAVTEKQALIAELAGTAAHELNQPLTSVMGYAELLKRKLDDGSAEHRAATTIEHEAERMADIVRKIGKITRYETKSYVGRQRILDLDRASDDPNRAPTDLGSSDTSRKES